MTSQRTFAGSLVRWALLLATLLLAAVVAFGIPVGFDLDPAQMQPRPEHAYRAQLPELSWPLSVVADHPNDRQASATKLRENGRGLGPAHALHADIGTSGHGRYSHWHEQFVFSTSDNSDPRTNGRRYVAVMRIEVAPEVLLIWLLALGAVGAAFLAHWFYRGSIDLPDFLLPLSLWTATALSLGAITRVKDTGLWLLSGVGAILLIWAVATTRRTVARGTGQSWRGFGAAPNATLALASLTVALVAAEVFLLVWERQTVQPEAMNAETKTGSDDTLPEPMPIERALESFGVDVPAEVLESAQRRAALITLPPELEQKSAEVEGAEWAYTWHGVLHVKDANNFRRIARFPPDRRTSSG